MNRALLAPSRVSTSRPTRIPYSFSLQSNPQLSDRCFPLRPIIFAPHRPPFLSDSSTVNACQHPSYQRISSELQVTPYYPLSLAVSITAQATKTRAKPVALNTRTLPTPCVLFSTTKLTGTTSPVGTTNLRTTVCSPSVVVCLGLSHKELLENSISRIHAPVHAVR